MTELETFRAETRAWLEANCPAECRGPVENEDFASMLEVRPGCYIVTGNGNSGPSGCMVHNPGYDFNDAILPVGAAFWSQLTQRFLNP